MTRKDYIKLAAMLNEHLTKVQEPALSPRYVFDELVNDICSMLKTDNSRFDKERFKNAVYK